MLEEQTWGSREDTKIHELLELSRSHWFFRTTLGEDEEKFCKKELFQP